MPQLAGKYDVITVSEIWLDHTVSNKQFHIHVANLPGYHPLFRQDRPGPEMGGGVVWRHGVRVT